MILLKTGFEQLAALVASVLVVSSPAAAKCHLFSVWHYPKPQRCFTALAPLPPERIEPNQERIEIPVILLPFEPAPDGDERLLAIAKLRALMDASPVGQR